MKIDVTLENARAILLKKSPMFTKDRDRRSPFEATILEVSPSGNARTRTNVQGRH